MTDQEEFEKCFEESNRIPDERELVLSPSGKYKLIIDEYKLGTWVFTKGVVKEIKEDKTIADIKRRVNYFFYYWITHPNNNEYLLCSKSYNQYLVVNLSQRKISQTFIPKVANPKTEEFSLVWNKIYPSPDKLVLAVYGELLGYKTEVRFYDFSNLDDVPFKEIGRTEEWGDINVIGWEDNNTFVFATSRWRRLRDNKSVQDLTMAEIQELDDDREGNLSIVMEETGKWQRNTNSLIVKYFSLPAQIVSFKVRLLQKIKRLKG